MPLRHHSVMLVRLLLLLSLLLQGCSLSHPVDLGSVSDGKEAELAANVDPFVVQRLGGAVPDEAGQAYLMDLATRLMQDRSPVSVHLVNDPEPAAYVLPGREVVISRGLFYLLDSEEDLVAVLAHLCGHMMARDGLWAALSAAPVSDSASGDVQAADYAAAAMSVGLLSVTFGEAQEMAADRAAAKLLTAAGYSSAGLLWFARAERHLAPQGGDASPFITVHPLSRGRLRSLEEIISVPGQRAHSGASEAGSFAELHSQVLESRDAYDLYRRAVQAEKRGEGEHAIDLYLQAAAAAPEESLLLTGLGMAYMRQEVLVAARQHLSRASRIDNGYYYPQLGLGYIYLQQGDLTQAVKRLRRAQSLLPTAQGGYLLGQAFDLAGERTSALKVYRDVVRNFPNDRLAKLARERIAVLEATDGLE